MIENELPTIYELQVYELIRFVLYCVREEHIHYSLNRLLFAPKFSVKGTKAVLMCSATCFSEIDLGISHVNGATVSGK